MICLSEDGLGNLGLACTAEGLRLGQTSLIERRDGRFVVRDRHEIARLLMHVHPGGLALDRLMPGLATVAGALNAGDQCLAHIAAVHLRIPDLPSYAVRDALAAEDALIKYARDESRGSGWNPSLHPRTGTPPNPGWFAPTDGESDGSSRTRVAENKHRPGHSDAVEPLHDDWVKLPPGEYIDELADFVEWIANARSEDEKTIRAEIRRYYYDVGDTVGGNQLNAALSDVLEPGVDLRERREILKGIAPYAHSDPAEVGRLRALITGAILALPGAGRPASEAATGAREVIEEPKSGDNKSRSKRVRYRIRVNGSGRAVRSMDLWLG